MRIWLKSWLVLCLFVGLTSAGWALENPVELTILHTSDIHAHLLPFDCASGTSMGGYARIKAYKDRLEAQGRTVVMVSSGDVFQGTLFFRFFRGLPDVAFMNQTGYCAMAVGNHEFDNGQPGLIEAFKDARFPILAANLRFGASRDLQGLVKPSVVVPVKIGSETLKLGFIGLSPEKLMEEVPRPFLQGIVVEPADQALKREIPRVQAAGADALVVLAHLGWSREVELADQFPQLVGMLGGHSHLFVEPPVVRTGINGHQFIAQSGEFGRAVTRLDLRLTPTSKGVRTEVLAAGLMAMDSSLPEDPEIKRIAESLWKQVEEKVNIPLGETPVKLDGDKPGIRERETNLGNLVADGMLRALPGDLALINGGGVRSSIQAGTITIGDCLNVLPFDNYLVRLTMPGEVIIKLFEQVRGAMATQHGFGGFLHVSGGMRVTYTSTGTTVELNGSPLDRSKAYTVVTNDFLAGGGNGLSAFREAATAETSAILNADALIRIVKEINTVNYLPEGRIIYEALRPVLVWPVSRLRIPRPRD